MILEQRASSGKIWGTWDKRKGWGCTDKMASVRCPLHGEEKDKVEF